MDQLRGAYITYVLTWAAIDLAVVIDAWSRRIIGPAILTRLLAAPSSMFDARDGTLLFTDWTSTFFTSARRFPPVSAGT